jgi:predicted nuclease of predicted toxin-antitoxin system
MQMIKIVCDVHISFKIVRFLESKNVKAVHVNDILDGDITKDNKIAEFVDENNYILMTKDADFQNSHFLNKSPKKLIQN